MTQPDSYDTEVVRLADLFEDEAGSLGYRPDVEKAVRALLDDVECRVHAAFSAADAAGLCLDAMTVTELTRMVMNAIRSATDGT